MGIKSLITPKKILYIGSGLLFLILTIIFNDWINDIKNAAFFGVLNIILITVIVVVTGFIVILSRYSSKFQESVRLLYVHYLTLFILIVELWYLIPSASAELMLSSHGIIQYYPLMVIQRIILTVGFPIIYFLPFDRKWFASINKVSSYITVAIIVIANMLLYTLFKVASITFSTTVLLYFEIIFFILVNVGGVMTQIRPKNHVDYCDYCIGIWFFVFAQVHRIIFVGVSMDNLAIFNLFRALSLMFFLRGVYVNSIDQPIHKLTYLENQFKLYAKKLQKIIDKKTIQISESNNRLTQELEYARIIQQSLLPRLRQQFGMVNFQAGYFPCEKLSGDFYDIFIIDQENIGMYLLDVSGHGISAALMTMFASNYLKSNEATIKRYRGVRPEKNLEHFYKEFNAMNFPDEMHLVIFYASYNTRTRVLNYASGGMNCDPILIKRNGTYSFLDESKGFPICKLDDFFKPTYESISIDLYPGDRILFYTDGLIDKRKNRVFSKEELVSFLLEYNGKSIEVLNEALHEAIGPRKDILDDDITYFIMSI